ncbi:hypothetical protein PG991_010365 [Apiospora marii]|uniref:Uncharacterized protein n=1 Tax=Apiospora marii TaxID=335849 RepID=A0ABR1RIB3_9PEZI
MESTEWWVSNEGGVQSLNRRIRCIKTLGEDEEFDYIDDDIIITRLTSEKLNEKNKKKTLNTRVDLAKETYTAQQSVVQSVALHAACDDSDVEDVRDLAVGVGCAEYGQCGGNIDTIYGLRDGVPTSNRPPTSMMLPVGAKPDEPTNQQLLTTKESQDMIEEISRPLSKEHTDNNN